MRSLHRDEISFFIPHEKKLIFFMGYLLIKNVYIPRKRKLNNFYGKQENLRV